MVVLYPMHQNKQLLFGETKRRVVGKRAALYKLSCTLAERGTHGSLKLLRKSLNAFLIPSI